MIAYRIGSCDVERVGTKLVRTLDKLRSLLGSIRIQCLVRLAENLPYSHELDIDACVDQWMKDGHDLPTVGDGAVAHVLKRLRARRSVGFLLKKELD